MINKFKKMFKTDKDLGKTSEHYFKQSKEEDIVYKECKECSLYDICDHKHKNDSKSDMQKYLCNYTQQQHNYNPNKQSILLLDDSEGIVSVLEDDLETLNDKGLIKLSDYNVLKFTTQNAGFNLLATLRAYNGLNIKYALFDITLGGGIYTEEHGNIILDGVDVFIKTKEYNKDLRFVFFTGNKLNPHIKRNANIIQKFYDFTKENITKYVLYKTSLSRDDRQFEILKLLTKDSKDS